jgi:DNA-binding winged helix-turn-helix (wHTH) protein/tetratricopeptide (TPR) repeat protein
VLKLADLAGRADFVAGPLRVSPARRLVEGPAGSAHLEPIVMKVFLLLLDSRGSVVTRDELFGNAWGGVFVGDDSLNRAIARVRRIAFETAPGLFEIETIPRTGYRLTGSIVDSLDEAVSQPSADRPVSRRRLISTGVAAIAAVGGLGAWLAVRDRSSARFNELIEQAESAIRTEDANTQIIQGLETAVAIRPGSAKAWGLLGFFNIILAQLSDPKEAEPLISRAQEAARRALSIDPREPNALLAMFELEGSTLDWFTRDQRLRRIIAIDPTRIWAIAEFVLMLQAAGMNRESRNWNERAISLVPLSLDFLSKRALKLWIAGRVTDADKVIDQVRALYPTNNWAWFCRFLIFATTGRAHAAQVMLNSNPAMIPDPAEANMWRAGLSALLSPSAAAISHTRQACFDAAKIAGQTHGQGVMILSQLGDLDGAFAIADGSLLARGTIILTERPGSKAATEEAVARVNIQWIFTPPCAAMRADPRFAPLCEGIGLTEYWRRRGVQPDYMRPEH